MHIKQEEMKLSSDVLVRIFCSRQH